MKNYPPPHDVTRVRQFLGLASYYRRFIPSFAQIASPLHVLTKKNVAFHWTTKCERAFEQLKDKFVSALVLVLPKFDPNCSFVLETDASASGLGAILSQAQPDGTTHPVAYASTIQEMDLTIRHKPGRLNSNGSCPPSQVCMVNTVEEDDLPSVPDLKLIADQQFGDSEMAQMLAYLQDRKLPEESKMARQIVHESKQFTVINEVLYH